MIRSPKTVLALALAVLAMSAVVASAASASNFTADAYPTGGTATSEKGNDVFSTEAGKVECAAHFEVAALSGPSETATVTPTYTNCKAFGFLSATVAMEGCDYVFHTSGVVDVECPEGKAIVITASTCTATVGSQTGLESVTLANSGTGISAQANVGGIAYTVTKDGFLCPFGGTGAKTGATYKQGEAIQVSPTGEGTKIDIG